MPRPTSDHLPLRKRVLYSAVIAGVIFLLLEIAMIVFEPYLFKGFFEYDPDIGFKVRSYAMDSNRHGFNDRDYAVEKPANTYRILILGDSFNWMGGRDQNYVSYIRNKFKQRGGSPRIEVINIGYPMTHTAEQFEVLRKYGLAYRPDFVFLGFFLGNDYHDADPHRKRVVLNGTYYDIDRRWEITVFGHPIVLRSRVISFIWQQLRVLREFGLRSAHALTPESFTRLRRHQLQFFNREQQQRQTYTANIEYIHSAISKLKALLQARKIRFAVGLYPDQLQVDRQLVDTIGKDTGIDPGDFDLEIANKLLIRHLRWEKIEYVDLLNAFQEQIHAQPLYVPLDTHWNDAGNRLAANLIFEFLAERVPTSN